MLVEIMSDEFISYGKKRGKIPFHKGLNIVRGGQQSDNSIGKSTFLLAVDFCFGGEAYFTATDLKTRYAEVHHTIKFTFEFEGKKEHYSRCIVTPDVVNICNAAYAVIGTMSIDDFKQHLQKAYKMDLPGAKFRDMVSRFMRIYGKGNYNEKFPLEGFPKDTMQNGIVVLEKLFNYYSQIAQYKEECKKREDKSKAFKKAQKEEVLQVYVPTATQAKQNLKEIERLEKELAALTESSDIKLTDEEAERADDVLAIKSRITLLRRNRSKLVSQQNTVKINYDGTGVSSEDLEELTEYFPGVDIKKIAVVEEFHQRMHGILKEEIEAEVIRLQTLIEALDDEIEELQKLQRELGVPVTISQRFLEKHTELTRKIAVLKAQNKARESSLALVADVKTAKSALEEVESEILKIIADKINEQMLRYNDRVYPDKYAPVITIENNSKYSFVTPEDGGMGTGYKSTIVFDLSILKLTALPVIIHDSLMFNHIGYEPLEKIMNLYTESNKQIFAAYDKQDAPTKGIQEILDKSTVIQLSENGNELFGSSWAKKIVETHE